MAAYDRAACKDFLQLLPYLLSQGCQLSRIWRDTQVIGLSRWCKKSYGESVPYHYKPKITYIKIGGAVCKSYKLLTGHETVSFMWMSVQVCVGSKILCRPADRSKQHSTHSLLLLPSLLCFHQYCTYHNKRLHPYRLNPLALGFRIPK